MPPCEELETGLRWGLEGETASSPLPLVREEAADGERRGREGEDDEGISLDKEKRLLLRLSRPELVVLVVVAMGATASSGLRCWFGIPASQISTQWAPGLLSSKLCCCWW